MKFSEKVRQAFSLWLDTELTDSYFTFLEENAQEFPAWKDMTDEQAEQFIVLMAAYQANNEKEE